MNTRESRLPAIPLVPADAAQEIDNIEAEIHRFLHGELSPERFRAFRLGHGIYGQRQPGVQMLRVKIPSGILNGRQLRRLADISEEFSTGVSHLTTRQDLQFHYVPLPRVPHLLRLLAEVGLTSREACANSVRNITACPLTGVIAEEVFNVQPYSLAAYAYLVRNPFCQQMARKFKIAFSACPEDCAATAIHDIGLLGRVEEVEGRTRCGFRVVVGGGLGSTPFVAQLLEEFVPLQDLLPTLKGILKVFTDYGNRRNKQKARLKFVVHKMGIARYRQEVVAAKRAMTATEREEARLLDHVPQPFAELAAGHLAGRPELAEIRSAQRLADASPSIQVSDRDSDAFARWRSCSVRAHQDPQRLVVTVLFPLGDLDAARLRALARLVTTFSGDEARVARDQNLVLPSVKREELPALYEALAALGLAEAGVGTALDVTACPGADTCAVGITSSKGLTRALREELVPLCGNGGLEAFRGVTIKISGCPNSCGQHHIASIGLHGVVKQINGKAVPAYQLHLGGRVEAGTARIGKALDKIPARNVPRVVMALLSLYRRERAPDESFPQLVDRLSPERIQSLLKPLIEEPPPPDEPVVDWGQSGPFSTEEIGTGECAGAGTDRVVDPFDNVQAELLQASLFMDLAQWADALANLNRCQYTLAQVLLDRLGKHPDSDYECACELRAQVIDRGYAKETWNEIHREIDALLRSRHPDPAVLRRLHRRCLDLLEESKSTLALLEQKRQSASLVEVPG